MNFQLNRMFQSKTEAYQVASYDTDTEMATVLRIPKIQQVANGTQLVRKSTMRFSELSRLVEDCTSRHSVQYGQEGLSCLRTRATICGQSYIMVSRSKPEIIKAEDDEMLRLIKHIQAVISPGVDIWVYDESYSTSQPVWRGEAQGHLEAHVLARHQLFAQLQAQQN